MNLLKINDQIEKKIKIKDQICHLNYVNGQICQRSTHLRVKMIIHPKYNLIFISLFHSTQFQRNIEEKEPLHFSIVPITQTLS